MIGPSAAGAKIHQPSLVVTGTSSGIGNAIARSACAHGWRVFGGVRKESDARRLSEELGSSFKPLMFDVRDPSAIGRAAKSVQESLGSRTLDALVNNAGVGF